jgi:hypothetical protein
VDAARSFLINSPSLNPIKSSPDMLRKEMFDIIISMNWRVWRGSFRPMMLAKRKRMLVRG